MARASLVHQINVAATAMTATIATAANTSPLVPRSGGVEVQGLNPDMEKRLAIG